MSIDTWEQTLTRIFDTGNPTFGNWWRAFYGDAGDEGHDEYHIRKGFAYFGWLAFNRPYATTVDDLYKV